MNRRSLLLFAVAVVALAVPLLVTAATSAGDPDPHADADAGSGPLDAGPDTDADAAPQPLPSYGAPPFSDERSAEPRPREWASAPRVALDRSAGGSFATTRGPPTSGCEARRVREWMRIRCNLTIAAVTLLGGDREGLVLRLDPTTKEEFSTFPAGAEVVFPVRRGDRRVIEWLGVAFGYKGMNSVESGFVLSEQWAPGDERPLIVTE